MAPSGGYPLAIRWPFGRMVVHVMPLYRISPWWKSEACSFRLIGIKIYTQRVRMGQDKEIRWIGSSFDDLLAFPEEARRQAGFQLSKAQPGLDPDDWKPFAAVGAGTREIRINESNGIYRVMCAAKFVEAIDVLHCFQKQSQVTSLHDGNIAEARYRAVINERRM
jgi:phage-related protein